MIAAIDDGKELHVVKWTGRVRLHAGAVTYCDKEADAAIGVLQVPEAVLTHGEPYSYSMPGQPRQKRTICPRCRTAAQSSIT
jgi:hypothetical protein